MRKLILKYEELNFKALSFMIFFVVDDIKIVILYYYEFPSKKKKIIIVCAWSTWVLIFHAFFICRLLVLINLY